MPTKSLIQLTDEQLQLARDFEIIMSEHQFADNRREALENIVSKVMARASDELVTLIAPAAKAASICPWSHRD